MLRFEWKDELKRNSYSEAVRKKANHPCQLAKKFRWEFGWKIILAVFSG